MGSTWDLHGASQRFYAWLLDSTGGNGMTLFMLMATIVLLCIALFALWRIGRVDWARRRRHWLHVRGMPMHHIRVAERRVIAKAVVDAIDDAYLEGKITHRARKRGMADMARFLKESDLARRKVKLGKGEAEELKFTIWRRIASGLYEAKPEIPGKPEVKERPKGRLSGRPLARSTSTA